MRTAVRFCRSEGEAETDIGREANGCLEHVARNAAVRRSLATARGVVVPRAIWAAERVLRAGEDAPGKAIEVASVGGEEVETLVRIGALRIRRVVYEHGTAGNSRVRRARRERVCGGEPDAIE